MSGAFSAKVDISTKEAVAGLRAARTEAQLFGKSLNELDGIIRRNKQNLILAANEFTKLVAAQRQAAAAAKDKAQADIAAARAQGIANTATARAAELNARQANQQAQAARATAQGNLAQQRSALAQQQTANAAQQGANAAARQAAANQRQQQSQLSLNDSLSNTRYLMYDVGQTYTVLSAALMTIPAATEAVAMAYQRDFANVLRVNDELRASSKDAAVMKDQLKEIAGDMPVAFGDLTKITQLGAQMGINNDKLAQFTETTAKFVAVTGVGADTGSQLFGRMETSFSEDVAKYPDYFERLGASIAQVGADTVATDPEIAALLNQIGPLGASAGFTSSEITGLAAALASVRVQPELARGTLTRVFGQLNRYVAEGSPLLGEYAKVMGTTSDKAAEMWKSDPSQFFQSLMKGLQDTQRTQGELTTTFDKLDITASRDVSALTKLAVGYDTYAKSMESANRGFADGTALNEMSKPIMDSAIAKLQKLANSWQNLGDTLGAGSLGPLAELIDIATNLVQGLDGLVHDVPLVGALIAALMGFAAVTAIFLGFKAAQAFVIAGLVGFQQASSRGIGAAMSMSGVLKQSAAVMLMNKGATEAQTRALLGQVGGWKALQIAMTTSSARAQSMNTVTNAVATSTARATTGVRGFASGLLGMVGGPIGIAIMGLSLLGGAFLSAKVEAEQAGQAIAEAMNQGADSGRRAIAEQLNNRKVKFSPTEGDAAFFNLNQGTAEVAKSVDVDFKKIVDAIEGGTESAAKFKKKMDELSANEGDRDKASAYAWLGQVAVEMADSAKTASAGLKEVEKAAPKAGAAAQDGGDDFEETASKIDKMTKALKDLNDQVFGTLNAEADLQGALQKIGESMFASKSFSPNNEGGRENLKNFQDAMEKSRDYYFNMMKDGTLTAEQAAQGYSDFIQGLINEIKARGGDTSGIEGFANATAQKFAAAIDAHPAVAKIVVSEETVLEDAKVARNGIQGWLDANGEIHYNLGVSTTDLDTQLDVLTNNLVKITGMPYEVVMDALTNPASEKAQEIDALLLSITNDTYTAAVDADTSAAIANVQNFVAYARTELAHLQTKMNGGVGYGDGEGSMNPTDWAKFGAITAPKPVTRQVRKPVEPTVAPKTDLGKNLQGIADGYDKAGKAAEKAGKKAKQAAEDMADGITDAVRQAEDYANRLKTGLTSAFNQQYALTTATDQYHSALNAINKKREDEIKQVSELRDKVRELNDERNKELITANKAKIEQGISVKYGELDRAADYGQQATQALNNAAAKQKDIDASKKQADEVEAGIGLLTGYSDAAIANRAALRDLESKTLDMIAAYAAQGHSIDEVRAYAQQLTSQFQTDVGQLGYNQLAVQALQGDLGRYIDVVNRVPEVKPTKVEADTEDATNDITAFNDLLGDIPETIPVKVEISKSYLTGPGEAWSDITMPDGTIERVNRGQSGDYQPGGYWQGGQIKGFAAGGMVPGQSPADPSKDNMMARVDGKGLIGIRSREWIMPEPAVDYYGPSMMEAIQTMKLPKYFRGGSPSGATGGGMGGGVVDLGAETLRALTDAMRTEVALQIDSREIARASNKGNKQLSAEGQN